MWEDIFIKVLGQSFAFALLAGAWVGLNWIFKKIFKRSEDVKPTKKGLKYDVNDTIEVVTKDGINIKGVITHAGNQSYNIEFEKPVSFNDNEAKINHSLYETELYAINNKILKADIIKQNRFQIGDEFEIIISDKEKTLKGTVVSIESDSYIVEFEDYFSLYNSSFEKVYNLTEKQIDEIIKGELKGCSVKFIYKRKT